MLTLQKLKDMPPKTIFATGEILDNPHGINMTNSGKRLRWVAVRGGMWDWAIYCHWAEHSAEWVSRQGDKVMSEHNIKHLVDCDDEAFAMYRF